MSNFSENLAPRRPCRRIQAPQATAASKEAICKDLVPGQRTAGLKPLRQGDALVSCRPDRLGRDTRHLLIVGKELAGGGISLQCAKKPGEIRQRIAQLCPLSTPRRHVRPREHATAPGILDAERPAQAQSRRWAEFEPERIREPARAGGETARTTWSVRVCGKWRVAFRFEDGETVDANLIDYH